MDKDTQFSQFALGFISTCLDKGQQWEQICETAKAAGAIDEAVAQELEPLIKEAAHTKQAGWGDFFGKLFRGGAAATKATASGATKSPGMWNRFWQYADDLPKMRQAGHAAGRSAKVKPGFAGPPSGANDWISKTYYNTGYGLGRAGQFIRRNPFLRDALSTGLRGATGYWTGEGLDYMAGLAGVDTGGWGGIIGGTIGALSGNRYLRHNLGKALAKNKIEGATGANRVRDPRLALSRANKFMQFNPTRVHTTNEAGELRNPWLSRAHTAAVAIPGYTMLGLPLVSGAASGVANHFTNQKLHEVAAQAGFTDANEMIEFMNKYNSGDMIGLLQHGWGKLSPQQKTLLLAGGAGLLGSTALGATGTIPPWAALAGAGLSGAGVYAGLGGQMPFANPFLQPPAE